MTQKHLNRLEFLGTAATLSSTIKFDSGPRMQMATTQAGQAIVPAKSDFPRIVTGFEEQLAKFTFGVKSPDDLCVIAVIPKYQKGIGYSLVKQNPLLTIIYRSLTDHRFGVFHIEAYQNQLERVHETFSFKYRLTKDGEYLCKDSTLRKGTVLTTTPNVTPNGYATGISANVAYMSTPYTIEDGFEVSESFMKRATPLATASRVAEWGKKWYPLNIYADPANPGKYKPFPGVGDKIRDDGVIFALRKHNPLLAGLCMTEGGLRTIDYKHDKLIFGRPGAEVVDVTVNTNTNEGRRTTHTPAGMEEMASAYESQMGIYYSKILDVYNQIRRESGGDFKLTPELQTLIVSARGDKPNATARMLNETKGRKNSIEKTWRADPLDEWRVEVMYAYQFPMGEGSKISNRHGGRNFN